MSTGDEQQAEQQEHQERRDSAIDIMASWALEGMEPSPDALARIREYVAGNVSLDEAIARAKAHYQRGIPETTRRLNAALGATLVAALAGSKDPEAPLQWAKVNGPQPQPAAARRLTFAYEQWQTVSAAEGEQLARAWFTGANPWLSDDTPVNAIREGHLVEVSRAAQALVDDAFSG